MTATSVDATVRQTAVSIMLSQLNAMYSRPAFIESQRPLPVAAKQGRTVISTAVASETFCKDVVNVRKEVKAEGSAMVTFMGAEGSVVTVECPKVPLLGPPSQPRGSMHAHAADLRCTGV